MRDARIAPIYEGTNGIQAIDLVMRKLPLGNGNHAADYIGELREIAAAVRQSNRPEFGSVADRLDSALDDALAATDYLMAEVAAGRVNAALSGATPYLRLISLAAGGAYLAKGALAGHDAARLNLARFYAENIIAETSILKDRVIEGSASLAAAAELLLSA
jgi:acyl-CoA dehydrogenase